MQLMTLSEIRRPRKTVRDRARHVQVDRRRQKLNREQKPYAN